MPQRTCPDDATTEITDCSTERPTVFGAIRGSVPRTFARECPPLQSLVVSASCGSTSHLQPIACRAPPQRRRQSASTGQGAAGVSSWRSTCVHYGAKIHSSIELHSHVIATPCFPHAKSAATLSARLNIHDDPVRAKQLLVKGYRLAIYRRDRHLQHPRKSHRLYAT